MKRDNPKEDILKMVRQALGKGDQFPEAPELASPVLKPLNEEIEISFAENFVKTKGIFNFCEDERELISRLSAYLSKNGLTKIFIWEKALADKFANASFKFSQNDKDFINAEVGITTCDALIARTGSIIVSNGTDAGRRLGIYPHIHIVVAYTSQIVTEIADGMSLMRANYNNRIPSMVSLVTGPSRTADIEKTLVLGAHGPKELVLFLLDDNTNTEA